MSWGHDGIYSNKMGECCVLKYGTVSKTTTVSIKYKVNML